MRTVISRRGSFRRLGLACCWTITRNIKLLRCPSDGPGVPKTSLNNPAYPADSAPRSYIINGFNDYFQETLTNFSMSAMVGQTVKESLIKEPTDTIVFGEKRTESIHYYMDFLEPPIGNDVDELEHARHGGGVAGTHSGGSDYAFADGSARNLKYGKSLAPLNMWAVTDLWRHNSPFNPP